MSKRKSNKLWLCSYAYDVPCYRDFVVKAENWAEAERKIGRWLKQDKFANVVAEPHWDNAPEQERVFVQCETIGHEGYPFMADVIKEGK